MDSPIATYLNDPSIDSTEKLRVLTMPRAMGGVGLSPALALQTIMRVRAQMPAAAQPNPIQQQPEEPALPQPPPSSMPLLPLMFANNNLGAPSPGAETPPPGINLSPPQNYTPNVDPLESVLNRMVSAESGGNPRAVSPKGAMGLLQIMPATARQYGVSDPQQLFDPGLNRQIARAYLGDLLNRYRGNLRLAVEAYNAGPGNIDKGIVPRETRDYVNRILG
jgi:soluble lytic murein transglycosylase-like protein